MKRILAIALAVLMVVTMVPFSVFAEDLAHECDVEELGTIDAKEPTCNTPGTIKHKECPVCGKYYDLNDYVITSIIDTSKPATGEHSGGTATCENKAVCDECKQPYGELAAHDLEKTDANPATCTKAGNIEYWTCSVCSKKFSDAEGKNVITNTVDPKTDHNYDKEVVDEKYFKSKATCTEKATYYKSCVCGEKGTETFTTGTIDAGEHDFSGKPTKVEGKDEHHVKCSRCDVYNTAENCSGGTATCVAEAICVKCETEYGKPDSDNHDIKYNEAKAPTCAVVGWKAYYTCKREGCTYSTYEAIPATGEHKFTQNVEKTSDGKHDYECETCNERGGEVDCTSTGKNVATCTSEAICNVCEAEYGNALDHTLTKTDAKAPTCTENGNIEYWTCSVCSKTFSDDKGKTEVTDTVDAKKGHDFAGKPVKVEGENKHHVKCSRCDKYDDATDCSGGTATCMAKAKCEACGAEYGSVSTTHKYSSTATPTTSGKHAFECDVDGCTAKDEKDCKDVVTPVDGKCDVCKAAMPVVETCEYGHDWNAPVFTWSAAGTEATAARTCKRNSAHTENLTPVMTNTIVKATCKDYSKTTYTATVTKDGETYTSTNNIIGTTYANHATLTKVDYKAATCAEAGNIQYWTCSVCKKYFKDNKAGEELSEDAVVINKLNHKNIKKIDRVEPTCQKDGNIEYWNCPNCGKNFKAQDAKKEITDTTELVLKKVDHKFEEKLTSDKEATCYQKGEASRHCTYEGCTERKDIQELPATGEHKWNSKASVIIKATCTQEGQEGIGCKTEGCTAIKDGTKKTTEKLPHENEEVTSKKVEPTCEEAGEKVLVCKVCKTETKEAIEALGHDYKENVVSPTCTQDGYSTFVCQREGCGDKYVANRVDAFEHNFTNYVSDNNASCTKDGTMTATCENGCGTKDTIPDEGSMTEHELTEFTVIKAATCTEVGSLEAKCFHCEYTEEQEIEALGHDAAEQEFTIDLAPTCLEEGKQSKHCTRCDYREQEEVIAALGHDHQPTPANEATCTEGGYTELICTRCGDKIVQNDGPALGHDFKNYVPNGDATCTADGTKTAKCSRCDVTDTLPDTDSMLEHEKTTELIPATMDEAGQIITKCASCSLTETETIPQIDTVEVLNGTITYNEEDTIEPGIVVSDVNGAILTENKDYTVEIADGAKEVGTHNVTVKFMGNYAGEETVTFKVILGKTTEITQSNATKNSVKLTWTAVPGATGYRIYVRNAKTGNYKIVVKSMKYTSYTVENLKSGTEYTYAVKAFTKVDGSTVWAPNFTEQTVETRVAKTTKISVKDRYATIMTLNWKKVAGAEGYRVYVKNADGKWKALATVTGTSYKVKDLKPNKKYVFAVKAYSKINNKTVWAQEFTKATFFTTPKAPVVKAAAGKNQVKLSWAKVAGAKGYVVYMYKDGAYKKIKTTTDTSYTVTGLKKGVKVYFKVKAYSKPAKTNLYSVNSNRIAIKAK